jgi:L-iditol 2-dehydrogenase
MQPTSDSMRAVIWEGIGRVSLQRRPVPHPGPQQALVEIITNGLCSSDYPIVEGQVDGSFPGMILGHEPVGRVMALGEGCTFPALGQRVALDTMMSCGKCRFCKEGHPELCMASTEIGFSADGCFSDYAVFPAANLHVLPDTITDLEATLIEALTCQLGAIDSLNIQFGESVAILGSGVAALNFIQLARLKGAGKIGVSMKNLPERLGMAGQLGADLIVTAGPQSLRDLPQARADDGYDVVIDAVGTQDTALAALALARRGGKVLLYGLAQAVIDRFPLGMLIFRNLTLYGRTSAPRMWEPAIDLLGRRALQLGQLISAVVTLEEVPDLLANRAGHPRLLKRVVKIGG